MRARRRRPDTVERAGAVEDMAASLEVLAGALAQLDPVDEGADQLVRLGSRHFLSPRLRPVRLAVQVENVSARGGAPVPGVRLHVPGLGFQVKIGHRGVEPQRKCPLLTAAAAFRPMRHDLLAPQRELRDVLSSKVLKLESELVADLRCRSIETLDDFWYALAEPCGSV
ncbi:MULTISPECIES: hypothetical protein [Streptomyces]|uniref:hypothetical protein n=1 Tax=Streptomyces TaxID=1883 RepID=UPI0007CD73DA|nr:hypothetical protein A4V12_29735 [Streptomyces noursei]